MKNAILLPVFLLAAHGQETVFIPPPGLAPPPPALAGIVGNSKKLAITMSLDRDTYFVGEVVRLSMKAVNPTAQIMEVFDPFECCGSLVEMAGGRGGFAPLEPHSRMEFGPGWSGRTVWLGPNQELRYEPRGREFEARGPGEYRLHLEAWAPANADYTVVQPVTEHVVSAEISEGESTIRPASRAPFRYKRYVHAAILRWQSESFLAVSDEASMYRPEELAAFAAERKEKAALPGPFIRVRQITEPIAELQATANREDTVELRWRSASGTWSTLSLPERGRKSAYEVLRSRDGAVAK